jgi:hypothetical protein
MVNKGGRGVISIDCCDRNYVKLFFLEMNYKERQKNCNQQLQVFGVCFVLGEES